MNRLLLATCLLAACGDKTKPAAPRTSDAPEAPIAATAMIDAGADASTAVALPKRTCPPAHAATLGSCSDGLRCVLLLAISDACVVTVVNQLDIPDLAMESDGAGLADLAWPTKDGALYLVNMTETWSWAALPAARTAPRDALTKVAWTPTKVGDTEPEGFQYGLATDGAKAYLSGCKKWGDDCGPDADECEEWHCTRHVFVDPHTRKPLARAPVPPFFGPPTTGKITDTVTLGKKGKTLTCASGADAPDEWDDEPLAGSVALSATDWLAVRFRSGSRMSAEWDVAIDYMRGCASAPDVDSYKPFALGPNRLWARAVDGGWELQHGAVGAPLTDVTGTIKAFGEGPFVFAAD